MPRDPYPFPRLQNDTDFTGSPAKQVGVTTKNHTRSKSAEGNAHDRLYQTATLSSSRREVFYFDPQAPQDSLDFVIKSTYDNHNEFLRSAAETLVQPETIGLTQGRVLKNRPPPPDPEIDMYKLPLTRSTAIKKENINSINGAIESHHSAATNGGYSRKHDGGFYTC
ncbi:predicted protein [Nematostella vectensis]|uniref:Uncharacterized protein n=1 Tax=Nematostella vectensis TaxID=45351 RepID=A7RT80_NEMVE|nr:protein CFAP276 [Nematostella vectensis]EDO45338.1 predicted protein [Nematostella vectensis]|eukprot:XP_001637401.1 predicted protein [Nematostella vectensis]